ncbi:putative ATP synthase YscN [Poriferisphaera corsica]|uniref:Putative ATP synthase YscN n=1 Tax=Poriferisphaera corsica TaxID=2528020 RepID=A0A517YSH6_9BACT|nr:FliI/YscN family ATPase [Poriferisphaera corsica]QDU33168.1 putative ATP synthase YscN [Poriferisphaera corsica]
MTVLSQQIEMLEAAAPLELRGTVVEVRGLALRVADLPVPIGSMVRITPRGGRQQSSFVLEGEVVGFDEDVTIVMPFGELTGVKRGDRVIATQFAQYVRVGEALLGRVLDGLGRPIDHLGPVGDTVARPLNPKPVDPLDRPRIDEPLATGVRAVDTMMSVGRGQRVGVFAGPGMGKSTLLGMMAKHTAADVSVIALVGERGREVKDFVEGILGAEGLARSVVVVATSDEPALVRIRSALVATAIAEFFRDQGLDVLMIMDSVTRFCQAQRQVGLAAGEPPTTKGFPPSVFAMLPRLLERSGRTNKGSITGLYSILVEGEDMTEPVADACRGILDGHIQLSRKLAEQGHYPAIDVLGSVSRVMDDVTMLDHQKARREIIKLLSSYAQVEDLLNIGAYTPGSNPDFDLAIACKPAIDRVLQQTRDFDPELSNFERTRAMLLALNSNMDSARQQLAQQQLGMQTNMQMPS